ncbi:MAG: ABC transporter permease [Actinobacteria bacterium]|nr:ABC transporter permease [Actinomycetota bacterium]
MSVTDPAQTDLGYTDPNPRRETPWSRSQVIVTPVVSVLLALTVGGLLILIQGVNPLTAYWVLFSSALGDVDGLVTVMEKSTPLILTGLAFTVGLRTGLFNIGAQGQLLVGAIGAAWAGYNFQMPAIIHLPFAIAFGILCGAAWASIAGVLRAYRSVSEVITTIMLNAVAIALVDYLASKPLQEPDQPLTRTPPVADTAALPEFGVIPSGFVIALFVSLFFGWFLARTTQGFRFNTVGLNPSAANYAGIGVKKTIFLAMAVSGALAGMGGAVETLGITGRFEPTFNAGLGFDGITIALLARNIFAAVDLPMPMDPVRPRTNIVRPDPAPRARRRATHHRPEDQHRTIRGSPREPGAAACPAHPQPDCHVPAPLPAGAFREAHRRYR